MTKNKLMMALQAAREALEKLDANFKALQDLSDASMRGVCQDAVIKRYEVAFEYMWKLFRAASEYEGSEAFGPRPAIQEAIKYEWIDDPEFWAAALDARNGSVHDYFGVSIENYLSIAKEFLVKATDAVDRIGNNA